MVRALAIFILQTSGNKTIYRIVLCINNDISLSKREIAQGNNKVAVSDGGEEDAPDEVGHPFPLRKK